MTGGTYFTSLLLASFLLLLTTTAHAWLNEFDKPVHFQCPAGQFLAHVSSIHNNYNEDREWDFECRDVPVDGTAGECHWTHFVNDWDQPLTYQCPGEGFITGTASEHDNKYEDRRFSFQCCSVPGTIMHSCAYTNWVNAFDGAMDYLVPAGKVMRGVDSFHDNYYEDRRFKFEICDLGLLEG